MPGSTQIWAPDKKEMEKADEQATILARAEFAKQVAYLKVEVEYLASLRDMVSGKISNPYFPEPERKIAKSSPPEVSEAIRAVSNRLSAVAQSAGTFVR